MFFRRQRTTPQRAGTAAAGSHQVAHPQGHEITLPARRHALWLLADGEHDVPALAQALGWPEAQVWAELDALADDGLLQRRAAPPAGGAVISRRRLLRGGLPALALAVPAVAAAQDSQEQFNKTIGSVQESLDKASAEMTQKQQAEQSGKQASQEAAQKAASNFGESLNKFNSEQAGKPGEQLMKNLGNAEQGEKEQALKAANSGSTNAVPEPGTLALVGLAGAAVYLQRHLRERAETPAEPAKPEDPAAR